MGYYDHRRYYLLALLTVAYSGMVSGQNDLFIRKGQDQFVLQDDRLTGGGFVLDLTPNPPSGCDKVVIRVPLNSDYGFSQVVYNGGFTVLNQTSTEVVIEAEVTGGQNLGLNMYVARTGEVCENQPIPIAVDIQFFDELGYSCGPVETTNSVVIIPKYRYDYDIDLSITNLNTQCIGGYTRYEIRVDRLPSLGGFNLTGVTYSAIVKGEVVDISMPGLSTSIITDLGNCQTLVEWEFLPEFEVGGFFYKSYLMIKNSCSCYDFNVNTSIDLRIEGTDPCGNSYMVENDMSNTITSNCCNSAAPIDIFCGKLINGIESNPFCSGLCTQYNYSLPFSNKNNPFSLVNFEIYDAIPEGVIVTGFQVGYFSGDDIEVCYTTNISPAEICKTLFVDFGSNLVSFSTNGSTMSNIQLTSGERITSIKFRYLNDIPAWRAYNYNPLIRFRIESGFPQLQDNVAVFSASTPNFQKNVTYVHPSPILPCNAEYYSWFKLWNSASQSWSTFESTHPNKVARFQVHIFNLGSGTSPDATFSLQLPPQFIFQGVQSMTYSILSTWTSTSTTSGTIPSDWIVDYNSIKNTLTIDNIEVEPTCGSVSRSVFEFDVLVKDLTPPEAYPFIPVVNDKTVEAAFIVVNDFYKIESNIYQRCDDGQQINNQGVIISGEQIELILELENRGNIPIHDIKYQVERSRTGDVHLNSGVDRNSEFDLIFSGPPMAVNNESFQYAFKSSIDLSSLCTETTSGSLTSGDYLVIIQDPGINVLPGEKFQISLPYIVSSSANDGQFAFNNFHWCLKRPAPDDGISDQVFSLEVGIESACPEVEDCELEDEFFQRVENAFSFDINGYVLEINSSSLVDNDRWYPIWNDDTYGGFGFEWGSGSYQHNYSETGSYEVCVVLDHFQIPMDQESFRCHCDIICETITIE